MSATIPRPGPATTEARARSSPWKYPHIHGDNGAGLGASHQTGWTGIVADMIRRQRGADIPTIGEILEQLDTR